MMGNTCWPPRAVKLPTGRQMLLTSAANNETREFYNSSKCVANLLKVCDPKASAAASLLYFPPARALFSPPIEVHSGGADGKKYEHDRRSSFSQKTDGAQLAALLPPFSEIIFRPAAEPRAG
jgi:hypothetical protein